MAFLRDSGSLPARAPGNASAHIAALDGLRGIAAIAVMFLHSYRAMGRYDLIPHAYLAADFFFLLSGFVIAKAYERKLCDRRLGRKEFMKIRLIRLYPMIIVGIALGSLALAIRVSSPAAGGGDLLIAAFSNLLLLPTTALFAVHPEVLYPVDVPEWSLFFEIVMNAAYAGIIGWLGTRRLAIAVIAAAVALLLTASCHDGLDVGANARDFFSGFGRVTFPFLFGVLLFRLPRPSPSLGNGSCLAAIALLGAVLFMPAFKPGWVYDLLASLVLFPLIVFASALCRLTRMMRIICLGLGDISYPLYISHQPVIRIAINGLRMLHFHLSEFATILVCATGALSVAALALYVWDKPARAFLSRKLLKAKTSTA